MINQLIIDQAGTFTVLLSIQSSLTALCNATPITTTTIISAPGTYCLAQALSTPGATPITISANNVLLDLNGYFVSGATGIAISNGFNNITIQNGGVTGTTAFGVNVGSSANSITVQNMQFQSCAGTAINFLGPNDGCVINNVVIQNTTSTGVSIASTNAFQMSNLSIVDCTVAGAFLGISLSGNGIQLSNIYIANCQSTGGDCYGIITDAVFESLFQNISLFQLVSATGDTSGMEIGGSTVNLDTCLVNTLSAVAGNAGGIVLEDCQYCIISNCYTNSIFGLNTVGIACESGLSCRIINSSAVNVIGTNSAGSGGILAYETIFSVIDGCFVQAISGEGIGSSGQGNIIRIRVLSNVLRLAFSWRAQAFWLIVARSLNVLPRALSMLLVLIPLLIVLHLRMVPTIQEFQRYILLVLQLAQDII